MNLYISLKWLEEHTETDEFVSVKNIHSAPSIDIVRCEECKNAFNVEGEWICNHLSGMVELNVVVKADGFCSYGERRTDG